MKNDGKKICIIGASGKLGRYMVEHALEAGHEVVAVCRPESVNKLADFASGARSRAKPGGEGWDGSAGPGPQGASRITIVPGRTNDRAVIAQAVRGCDGVLTVLVPWGMQRYASGTAQAVLDFAEPDARLVFSCGWHITRDGKDTYSRGFKWMVKVFRFIGRALRWVDLDDQVAATDLIFHSKARWTVVRGSDLEEGPSQGLPVWSRHVGDPILASNRTRRVDFALFMVHALTDDRLVREAPAIVGRETESARAHAQDMLQAA